jgi:MarR family transcriptional regulator, lower aerobic nicotinate degradation pathway regulator
MSNTKVISELITAFEQYEQEAKQATAEGFAKWLMAAKTQPTSSMNTQLKMGNKDAYANENVNQTDNAIGILISMMSKYARHYSKAAMEKLPLNSIEEFGYLAHLSTHGEMTKTALVSKGMDGKTTGMDIIRRLVENNLAKEINNPDDGRSILLRITEKGKKVLGQSYMRMGMVSKVVVGDLTEAEKKLLLQALQKLATYHQQNESKIIEKLKRV